MARPSLRMLPTQLRTNPATVAMEEEEKSKIELEEVERFAFYERAKNAYCIVATGESALYGNLILKKGVLGPEEA